MVWFVQTCSGTCALAQHWPKYLGWEGTLSELSPLLLSLSLCLSFPYSFPLSLPFTPSSLTREVIVSRIGLECPCHKFCYSIEYPRWLVCQCSRKVVLELSVHYLWSYTCNFLTWGSNCSSNNSCAVMCGVCPYFFSMCFRNNSDKTCVWIWLFVLLQKNSRSDFRFIISGTLLNLIRVDVLKESIKSASTSVEM